MTDLITDHVELAQGSLLPEWRDDDRALELLAAFAEEIQELEDVLYQLVVDTFLSTAEGVQLDEYGDLLGLERNGLIDEEYRALLEVRVLSNRAPGIVDTITEIARVALFSATGVVYAHNQPASYQLTLSPAFPGAEIHTQANAASIDNEADATTGWAATDATLASSSADPFLGSYSINATAPSPGVATLFYTFTTVPGTVYRVRFAARRLIGTELQIADWLGFEVSPDALVDSLEWKEYEFYVTANGVSGTVNFQRSVGPAGEFAAIDAFSVKPTSEPSAVLIDQAIKLILDATSAGVGLNAVTSSPTPYAFRFGDGSVGPRGFGNGKLAKLIGP